MVGSYPSSSPSAIIPDDNNMSEEDDVAPIFQIPESLPAVAVSAATAFIMRIVAVSDPLVNGSSGNGAAAGYTPAFTFGGYSRR